MSEIDHPVIVNTRALPEALRGNVGLEGIASINDTSDDRPIEEIDAGAAMANIFAELRQAENKAGATILTAPHDGRWAAAAARFQSLVASGEMSDMRYEQ